jgi:membrane protein DedA with SNARE-associated domain
MSGTDGATPPGDPNAKRDRFADFLATEPVRKVSLFGLAVSPVFFLGDFVSTTSSRPWWLRAAASVIAVQLVFLTARWWIRRRRART